MDKRLSNCNFIKAILMLTVVLYHSVLFWGGSWFSGVETLAFPSEGLNILSKILGSFHIYRHY